MLSANGTGVERSHRRGSRNIDFRVRKQTLGTGGCGCASRRLALFAELRSQIAALDAGYRRSGSTAVVVPENDLKTRVDILYTLLV